MLHNFLSKRRASSQSAGAAQANRLSQASASSSSISSSRDVIKSSSGIRRGREGSSQELKFAN